MKKQNLRSLKIFVKGSFLALMLTTSVYAVAQPFGDPIVKEATVKHISTTNEKIIFQLSLENETGERFGVSIKDEQGNIIFQNIYSEKKFDKKFILDKSETIGKLTFIVRSLKDNQTQAFEVNTTSRLIENVNVTVKKL